MLYGVNDYTYNCSAVTFVRIDDYGWKESHVTLNRECDEFIPFHCALIV
jgi:hypothetical protein